MTCINEHIVEMVIMATCLNMLLAATLVVTVAILHEKLQKLIYGKK